MQEYILHIKNMVCPRCIMVVRERLTDLGIIPLSVELGRVTLQDHPDQKQITAIKTSLEPIGFELIDDKRIRLVEKVKNVIIGLVHYDNHALKVNLSDYITTHINHDYSYISHLFSEIENTTIEQYFINQKIERAKELLDYGELSLNEIADLLHYSSAAHLSAQFKKVTGLTPSHFKKIKENRRNPLDRI